MTTFHSKSTQHTYSEDHVFQHDRSKRVIIMVDMWHPMKVLSNAMPYKLLTNTVAFTLRHITATVTSMSRGTARAVPHVLPENIAHPPYDN